MSWESSDRRFSQTRRNCEKERINYDRWWQLFRFRARQCAYETLWRKRSPSVSGRFHFFLQKTKDINLSVSQQGASYLTTIFLISNLSTYSVQKFIRLENGKPGGILFNFYFYSAVWISFKINKKGQGYSQWQKYHRQWGRCNKPTRNFQYKCIKF